MMALGVEQEPGGAWRAGPSQQAAQAIGACLQRSPICVSSVPGPLMDSLWLRERPIVPLPPYQRYLEAQASVRKQQPGRASLQGAGQRA